MLVVKTFGQFSVSLICLLDDFLGFVAAEALLSSELKLFELAVLLGWIHKQILT